MKKNLRGFYFLLVIVLISSILVGCTNNGGSANVPNDGTEEEEVGEEVTGEEAEEEVAETGEAVAFDAWPRPKMGTDDKLVVCSVHLAPSAESQLRSVHQIDIEIEHRGWELIDIVEQDANDLRDALLNCINLEPDVILLGNQQNMEAYVDLIDQARSIGIGVYNNDNQLVPGIIVNSTMPNGVAAMELMYTIGNANYWDFKIGMIGVPSIQVSNERMGPMEAVLDAYPNTEMLSFEDATAQADVYTAGYVVTKAWLEKYGSDIDGVICFADLLALSAAEAIIAAGDATGENTWTAGIDGGNQAWGYLRDNTPFQYNYSQPFELYTHKLFELMDQLQLQGMNPGDEGCLIGFSGDTMYSVGTVVTRENVPDVGEMVHVAYDYFDPEDTDAWYFWPEAGGPTIVEEGMRAGTAE